MAKQVPNIMHFCNCMQYYFHLKSPPAEGSIEQNYF